MRALIEILVVALILAIVAHCFFVAGLLAPVVVAGASMAPALPGPHRNIVCRACGLRFPCDSEWLPPGGDAICPNCYFPDNPIADFPPRPGARLIVDRAAWTFFTPRRWQPFVLVDPCDPRAWAVKRLVGLPGERIEIRAGDVWIDGRRAQKDLDALRSLAILVDDDPCHASAGALSLLPNTPAKGWRPARNESDWRRTDRGWRLSADEHNQPERDQPDWLIYHHVQAPRAPGLPAMPGPVLDDNAYEQAESRPLTPAPDLLVSFRAGHSRNTDWLARIDDGRDAFEIHWDMAHGECRLAQLAPPNETPLPSNAPSPGNAPASQVVERAPIPAAFRPGATIEFAQCDGRLLVAMNHATLFAHAYAIHETDRPPPEAPVSIGVMPSASPGEETTGDAWKDAQAAIDELRVLRDIYYLAAPEAESAAGPRASQATVPGNIPGRWRLEADRCFFLGDNTAWSQDSRVWPPDAGGRTRLIGPAIRVPRAQSLTFGGRLSSRGEGFGARLAVVGRCWLFPEEFRACRDLAALAMIPPPQATRNPGSNRASAQPTPPASDETLMPPALLANVLDRRRRQARVLVAWAERHVGILGGLVFAAIFLSPQFIEGYGGDDLLNANAPGYLMLRGITLWEFLTQEIHGYLCTGRVYPIALALSYGVHCLAKSAAAFHTLVFALLLMDLALFYRLLRAWRLEPPIASLATLFLTLLFQLRMFHDPILEFAGLMPTLVGEILSAMLAFEYYLGSRRLGWLALSVLAFAGALLTYEVAFMIAPVFWAMSRAHRGGWRRGLAPCQPHFALIITLLSFTLGVRYQSVWQEGSAYLPNYDLSDGLERHLVASIVGFAGQLFAAQLASGRQYVGAAARGLLAKLGDARRRRIAFVAISSPIHAFDEPRPRRSRRCQAATIAGHARDRWERDLDSARRHDRPLAQVSRSHRARARLLAGVPAILRHGDVDRGRGLARLAPRAAGLAGALRRHRRVQRTFGDAHLRHQHDRRRANERRPHDQGHGAGGSRLP